MDWITAEEARDLAKSSRVINNIIDNIMKRIETIASDGQYMASVTFSRTEANCIYEKIEEILEREWGYKVGVGFPQENSVNPLVEFQIDWHNNNKKEGDF